MILKIQDLETFLVGATKGRNWLFVRVVTDSDITGYGEATLEGREKTTETAILELKRYLLGKDPTEIERHWQTMFRSSFWREGPVLSSAISGVDQALWDILGKSVDRPIYKLLGGPCRHKVKAYTHVAGLHPEDLAQNAKGLVKKGFKALKLLTSGANSYDIVSIPKEHEIMQRRPIKETVERVAAVRDAVGEKVDIMLDAHGRLDPSTAIILAHELEPYNLLFFEEPIPPGNVEAMAWVSSKSNMPIAAGERVFAKYGFQQLLEKHAVAVVQPDISHAGGISECKKIASLAECYYASVAPHNPNSPVSTAAALQLDAVIPNLLIQETIPDDISPRKEVLKTRLELEDGFFKLPTGPGLGIELNEALLAELKYKAEDLPYVEYEDGSVTEW